jgi:acyl-coenzyme A synthetase/AMP-(fatty) acid ligase
MWLWGFMTAAGRVPGGSIHSADAVIPLATLAHASILGGHLEKLRGRTVLMATCDQSTAAIALIELDGVAQRLVLCPPDLSAKYFPAVIAAAGADAWVRDAAGPETNGASMEVVITADPAPAPRNASRSHTHDTEWILLTSGTTGAPKLVLHTLASLTSAITFRAPAPSTPVRSTFYDIRRYGGLQIFLRAALRGGSMVLSSPNESITAFLGRAEAAAVSHISGTPSHWRKALMSGAASRINPSYVRLSGEIADQAILDRLRAAYPKASVAHAFASTEAGVAFEVNDALAGFPATLLGASAPAVRLKIEDGTLRVCSDGNASRYVGDQAPTLRTEDGFVDTGDRVELRQGRYQFIGRNDGIINVGGLKVHPEEVEAVINSHPRVRMSLVKGRRSPITGAIVAADVVPSDDAHGVPPIDAALTREIIEHCRRALPAHKVPTMIQFVAGLEVSNAGKLVRPNA